MILCAADYCIHNDPALGIVIFVFIILYLGFDAWAVRYNGKRHRKHRREKGNAQIK